MDYEDGMEKLKVKIKPQFYTTLDARSLNDDYWELIGSLKYDSKVYGDLITVPTGFVTDFASVPKWLPIAYAMLKNVGKQAAVVHDYLYQKHLCGKAKADRIFLEALKAMKVSAFKRWLLYSSVVAFGWTSYASGPDRYLILNIRKK